MLVATARADVTLPSFFGDNMVLQRDLPLPVWGWAQAGEKVSVSLDNNTVSTTALADGMWIVKLPIMKAGGPYEMTVTGNNTVTFRNVLVGEVWICSGQSNMEMAVSKSAQGAEVAAQAANPRIRLLLIPRTSSHQPARDVTAKWKSCTPETAAGFSAAAYFFGREINKQLDVPVGLIESAWGGTAITPWTNPAVGHAPPQGNLPTGKKPAKFKVGDLYNGMIHPLVPFGIRGAIWYQGEANTVARDGRKYLPKMQDLIAGWRTAWGQGDFPFYYVQLPPYAYSARGKAGTAMDLPELRQAQLDALSIANTGMAVTTDIGGGGLHPANKQDVGKRLALWALAKTYGRKDLTCSGPLYKSFKIETNKIRVSFDYGKGMKARGGKNLNWFEIAGEDRTFYQAKAVVDGETIVVSSDSVARPVAVRFGANQMAVPNLVNEADLPASPFLTDTWSQEEAKPAANDEDKPKR
jgi:sialate O-acetylesterase